MSSWLTHHLLLPQQHYTDRTTQHIQSVLAPPDPSQPQTCLCIAGETERFIRSVSISLAPPRFPRLTPKRQLLSPVVKGHDIIMIAQARPSTCKLVSYTITIFAGHVCQGYQVLILAPTHELAQQIQKVVVVALEDSMNIKYHAYVGGTNVREDMAKLQEGVHVVVVIPGRVYDMINRRALKSDTIKIFCLDEVDEMLSRGFKDQIYKVFQLLPQDTHCGSYLSEIHLARSVAPSSCIHHLR
ncbi:hypothetical protein D9757_009499 [Collybiopsis confluens]|uniref:Helicase ATP-binding domain-containing protein n=1 Tax=Collybiopsis confluens TaxID=2823264 RepID=A0A8H5M139_9AGAR|nr:hypothetical protein D9757_009499 [Collybiopsis confluens]